MKITKPVMFSLRNLLFFNVILLVFMVSFHYIYTAYTNTLWRNAQWDSSKVKLEKGLMGAWSFMLTYRALAHDRLDLGTWHGYQEIVLKDTMDYDSLSLDFRLQDSAFLFVYYAQEGDALQSIRLSAHPGHPSAWLSEHSLRFLEKEPLSVDPEAGVWHTLSLASYPKKARIYLDGHLLSSRLLKGEPVSVLKLKGSGRSTEVDNIALFDGQGGEVFKEDFSKKYHHYPLYLIFLILANAVFLLLYSQRRWLIPLALNLTMMVAALSVLFLTIGVEHYPPRWMIKWGQRVSTIEEAREVCERISVYDVLPVTDTCLRILFIGSSQTWGAGASVDSLTLVNRFAAMLSDTLGGYPVHAVNVGISGMNSDLFLEMYRDDWEGLNPHYVIINLGYNDSDNPRFEANLLAMCRLARERGGLPVLITEPVNVPEPSHLSNLAMMRSLALTEKIALVDMHNIIPEYQDMGFLYWDFIHLSDFGQEIFARELLHAFLPITGDQEHRKLPGYRQRKGEENP